MLGLLWFSLRNVPFSSLHVRGFSTRDVLLYSETEFRGEWKDASMFILHSIS
jgi:hypothetical protein